MAAYFSQDNVNRPGFAKLFFEAASEEREHAHKLIEYLSMRGRYMQQQKGDDADTWTSSIPGFDISELVKDSGNLNLADLKITLSNLSTPDAKSSSGLIALQNALKLEAAVTKSIRGLIKICEDNPFNHYHVSFRGVLNFTFNLNFNSHSSSTISPVNSSRSNTKANATWLARLQRSAKWFKEKAPDWLTSSSTSSCYKLHMRKL